jgi:hypothetical protein
MLMLMLMLMPTLPLPLHLPPMPHLLLLRLLLPLPLPPLLLWRRILKRNSARLCPSAGTKSTRFFTEDGTSKKEAEEEGEKERKEGSEWSLFIWCGVYIWALSSQQIRSQNSEVGSESPRERDFEVEEKEKKKVNMRKSLKRDTVNNTVYKHMQWLTINRLGVAVVVVIVVSVNKQTNKAKN